MTDARTISEFRAGYEHGYADGTVGEYNDRIGAVAAPTPDARTIITDALGPEVPASWRKQVADRVFTALRSAGFEVCAVAAPTITPQPTVPVAEVLRFIDAELAYNYNGDAREKALRHLRAKFDGVGGSITAADQEDTDE